MAGLSNLLNTARDALNAQSYGLNVAGQNVANANTPLYVRREAILQSRALGTQTTGSVEAIGLRRAADAYADRRYFEANANQSSASQHDAELQRVESLFNDLSGTGIGDTLDAVFQSFQQLSAQPESIALRNDVLEKVDEFASRSRQIGDNLATHRLDLLEDARASAEEASRRAQELSQLNTRIVVAKQSGEDASDLIDQRNAVLLGLSGILDVHAIENRDGSILVRSAGTTLVEGSNAASLNATLDADGKLQVLVSRHGGSLSDVTRGLTGGKLAGIKEAGDDLFEVTTKFDDFVFRVATAINAKHGNGVGLDGSTRQDVFDISATSTGAARTVRVSADIFEKPRAIAAAESAASLPGGSGNAVSLAKLATATDVFAGRTASEAYTDLVGFVGTKRASAASDVELRKDVLAQAESARESTSGVSLDEEMVNLQRYQRAYQAATKVITTVDALLQELIAKVGG